MVAEGGPRRHLPQEVVVHVEERRLVVGVGAEDVGVVAEEKPEVRLAPGRVGGVGVAHRHPVGVREASVAGDPDAHRLRRARERRRTEDVVGIVADERTGGRADRVVVLSVRGEPRERDDVLGRRRRVVGGLHQRAGRGAVTHAAVGRKIGAPAQNDARGRRRLQVRAAGHDDGVGATGSEREQRGSECHDLHGVPPVSAVSVSSAARSLRSSAIVGAGRRCAGRSPISRSAAA